MILQKGGFTISTDKTSLQVDYIHHFLSTKSYWAQNIPFDTVKRSIENSLCFGLYHNNSQIGFARVITDSATFGYLADVFIDEKYRGRGLSKWLIQSIISYPGLQGLRRLVLVTRDAHSLYEQSGFTSITNPERWMHIYNPDCYNMHV